jgi:uncharacterized repeat protein (TIGR01451 family)
MKKVVILTLLAIGLLTASANAALITNICTSTYQISGYSIQVSGSDSAAVTTETDPFITVTKFVKNIRTGQENVSMVPALQADTIEFRITWTNAGGATADTVVLTDYIPSGLTYVSGSLTNTEANCTNPDTTGSSATVIRYQVNAADGTNPGPAATGEIKFRVTVD